MKSKINDLNDVKSFIRDLVEMEINFHPDTDFADYISDDASSMMTAEKAHLFNRLLKQSILTCKKEKVDPYSFMLDCYLECSDLNLVIPSPGELGNS